LCEQYGLDTISTGGPLLLPWNVRERAFGGLTKDTIFLPVFGDPESLVKSVEVIAARKGIWQLDGFGKAPDGQDFYRRCQ
jgi:aldehyde:ferredoxin oxidoreductase